MDAKAEILERIRRASVTPVQAARSELTISTRSRPDIVDQFAEYVAEYRATVVRASEGNLAKAIEALLKERGSRKVVVPHDFQADWCIAAEPDTGFTHRELAAMQTVITCCALGIAETGTIVLDAGRGQGRRALSLIPDHHICLIWEDQVVDSIPEGVLQLERAAKEGKPLTWISGPSATSDIELSRVEGVHGPRILDVVIVSVNS